MNRTSWDPAARGPIGWLAARPAATFALLYLVALAVAWWFMATHHPKPYPAWLEADEREYYDLSGAILAGKAELTARRTLGFPLALAAIRRLHDDLTFLQGVIVALYALSSPLLALVARRIGGSVLAGIGAGLALAVWPPAVYYGTSLYSETLALPVFLAALALLPPGSRLGLRSRRPMLAAIACGAVLGIATHVRPMYLLFTPFVALIVLVEEAPLRRAIGRVALVAAGYCAVVLPWSAMMTARFHHPILVTSNGGETLSGGLNPVLLRPEGNGTLASMPRTTWYGPGKWLPLGQNGFLSEADQRLPYDRQDALLRARTSAWIAAHPGDAARLELAKIGYMWGVVGAGRNGIDQLLFGNLPTIALLIASIALLVAARGDDRRRLVRLWIVPLFVTAVALISWGSWRFRQPADAALLGFCSICVVERWGRRSAAYRVTTGA